MTARHVDFYYLTPIHTAMEKHMSKAITTDASATHIELSPPADVAPLDNTITPSFWLLKDGTAPKVGARAEGGILYQVLADADRQHLLRIA